MLRTIIGVYAILFIGFRVPIYFRTVNACGNERIESAISFTECIAHSDRYDQQCVVFVGRVVDSGHFWWDAFLIRSFLLRQSDGKLIRVFVDSAVPSEGEQVAVSGTFRQFYYGAYGQWIGLVETGHTDFKVEEHYELPETDNQEAEDEETPSIIDT